MSDVSGIPYMGPMGQGNFFAPQFSYNPQINPTAGYAAPAAYAQNVTNNLYSSGGGFGQQTAYYAGLGASYGRQISPSYENPYQYGGVPASLAYPGASLSGGYTTGPANMPSFDTGPNFGYTSGGMGAIDLSRAGNLFSGGLGSGGNAPAIDWSGVGQAAASLGGANPYSNMSMPGGLGSPASAPSGASPFNWSDLWGGGGSKGGGGYTSGIPPDTAGGGTAPSSPMTTLSSGGPSWEDAPTTPTMPSSERLPGYNPATSPTSAGKPYEQPAFDFSGPTAGWNNAPASMPSSERLLGYTPQQAPAEPDWNIFQSPPTNYETFQGPAQGGGQDTDLSSTNRSAQQLADDARARLATIIGSPETAKAVEEAKDTGAAAIPLPRERPAEAPLPTTDRLGNPLYPEEEVVRPPAGLPSTGTPAEQEKYQGPPRPSQGIPFTVEPGKEARVAGVDRRLYAAVQGGAQYLPPGYSVEVFSGVRNKPGDNRSSQHYSGNAMDVRIIGPDGEILPKGNDYTGMYTLLARGVKTWTTQNDPGAVNAYGGSFETSRGSGNPDLMHFDRGPARGSLRSDVQFGNLKVLSEAEKNAMPAYIPALGENQVPLDRSVPLGPGYSAPVPPLTDRALPTVPNYRSSGMSAGDFAAAPPRFMGGGGNDDSWTPQERTPEWNTQVYNPSVGPLQHRDESGAETRWSGLPGRPEDVIDRRFDTPLTRTQEDTLRNRGPGVPNGSYIETPIDKRPNAGGALGEMLGAKDVSSMEANAAAARQQLAKQSMAAPRATSDPFEAGDTEDATFNERYWPTLEPDNTTGMRDFQSPANDYSVFQQQPFIPPWQASIPAERNSPELREAVQRWGQQHDADPASLAAVVNTENPGWDPRLRDPDSSYVGLTQMGENSWKAPGMPNTTWPEYSERMTGPEQIDAYSQWLDSYGIPDRIRAAGIDIGSLPPEAQAALWQAFQFSPNAGSGLKGSRDWLTPYAQGDASMTTTLKPQADFLNEHPDVRSERPTMSSMTDYYRRLLSAQVAGAERRFPQQQLFNNYYPTQMPRH